MSDMTGKFYWPSDEYSTPAENHCWHVPPSPNADFKCIRRIGHPGHHHYAWSPDIRDYSHKDMEPCDVCGNLVDKRADACHHCG